MRITIIKFYYILSSLSSFNAVQITHCKTETLKRPGFDYNYNLLGLKKKNGTKGE